MGKVAGQRVTFRASARIGAIAASLAAAAALLLPNAALAATEIGSAQGDTQCTNTGNTVQASSVGASYAVPSGGTSITSWSVQTGPLTGPVGLEVWRLSAPSTYTLVGISPTETLDANPVDTFTLDAPITVQAGDLLGLRIEGPVNCFFLTQSSTDAVQFSLGYAPQVGDTMSIVPGSILTGIVPGFQLNIAASVDVTITPPPPPPTPTTAAQCKHGGWQGLTDSNGRLFKNRGDCVSFVATQGTNLAAG